MSASAIAAAVLPWVAAELLNVALPEVMSWTGKRKADAIAKAQKAVNSAAERLGISYNDALLQLQRKESAILTTLRDGNRNRNRVLDEKARQIEQKYKDVSNRYKKASDKIHAAQNKINEEANKGSLIYNKNKLAAVTQDLVDSGLTMSENFNDKEG